MAQETVIDRLVTEFVFRGDKQALDRINKGVKTAQKNLKAMSNAFLAVGGSLTAAGGAALKTFATFEEGMAKIHGLVDIPLEVLDEWRPKILEIGAAFGRLPAEMADAMFYITSGGLRGQRALDALRMSAKASAAGMGEMEPIAKLLASAMNAFDDLSAEKAMDDIAKAVELGQLDPATMAQYLGQVFPLASALKVQFGEVSGVIAAMSRTGTDVAQASTQVTAILSQFAGAKGTKTEDALNAIGMSVEGVMESIEKNGLMSTMEEINELTGGDVIKSTAIFTNIRALKGYLDLFGSNKNANMQVMSDMLDSAGKLEEAFLAMSPTLAFAFAQMRAAFAGIRVEVGASMKDTAIAVIESIRSMFDWFNNLSDGARQLIAKSLTLGPVLIGLGAVLRVLAFALKPIVLIMRALWLVMIANPVGLVITAFAALAIGAYHIGQNLDTVKAWLANFWDMLKEWAMDLSLVKWAVSVANGISDAFSAMFDWLADKFGWAMDLVQRVGRFLNFGGGDDGPALNATARPTLQLPGVTAPLTTAPAIVQSRQAVNKTANIQVDNLVVPGANAAEVAENLPGELARQSEALADSVDNHFGA